MANILGEFRNELEVARLSRGTLRGALEDVAQGFVVGKDMEGVTFNVTPEMCYCAKNAKQFTVEGGVLFLRV